MHGNPDGTKWNWVCDPPRSFVCVSLHVRVRVSVRACTFRGNRCIGLRKKTIDFHLPAESRAAPLVCSTKATGESKPPPPPPSLGTARSPCIRAGRQWPRVSEPMHFGAIRKSNRDRLSKMQRINKKNRKRRHCSFSLILSLWNFRKKNLSHRQASY